MSAFAPAPASLLVCGAPLPPPPAHGPLHAPPPSHPCLPPCGVPLCAAWMSTLHGSPCSPGRPLTPGCLPGVCVQICCSGATNGRPSTVCRTTSPLRGVVACIYGCAWLLRRLLRCRFRPHVRMQRARVQGCAPLPRSSLQATAAALMSASHATPYACMPCGCVLSIALQPKGPYGPPTACWNCKPAHAVAARPLPACRRSECAAAAAGAAAGIASSRHAASSSSCA